MKTQLSTSKTYPNPLFKLFLVLLLLGTWGFAQAQTLTVAGGQTVNITTNTYYDVVIVSTGTPAGTLNVLAPAVLTIGTSVPLSTGIVLDLQNKSNFLLSSGATLIVNGTFNNSNGSDKAVINGTVIVNGSLVGGNNSVIAGSGTLTTTGTITGAGTFFGSTTPCSAGPCNGNNLCTFSTTNTITAPAIVNFCNGTNTTAVINGSTIDNVTYQWKSSSTISGTYSNVSGGSGANTANYTPPGAISATIFYKRVVTKTIAPVGCTQESNIITVTIGAIPDITVQPSSTQTVCVGNAATFNVTATGVGLSYQWQKGAAVIGGATSSTYTRTAVLADNNTTYSCVVTSTCTTATRTSNSALLLVNNTALPVVTATVPPVYCIGGTITLTGTRSGGSGILQSVWTGPNGYALTSDASLNPTVSNSAIALMAGPYTHTVTNDNGTGCKASATATNVSSSTGTWVGTTSTAWNTGINWCGGVPGSTIDAIIPSGTTFQPTINTPSAIVRNVTINSGATLTLTNNIPFNIYGNFTNNGTFTDNGGITSYLGSAAQTALNMTTVKNLTLDNANGLTLSSNTRVNGILTLSNGALNSNGRLTLSLTTGAIAPTGGGSVVGTMTVRRESSDFGTADLEANFHYVGSPLAGVQFSDIADNVAFTSTNFYGYNENSGDNDIQRRWKSLVTGDFNKPITTLMNANLFTNGPSAMVGYALQFNNLPTTTEILDFTGTYTHGTPSFTTGSMSYTNGGEVTANGWQLLANPYPSYIDWRLVTTSNLEAGITYYNSTISNNAYYIPPSGTFGGGFNNGGSPFIPAMQAFWVQVKPGGNGVVTVLNSARSISPIFTGFGTVPNFYREARPTAHSLKLIASNDMGSDETSIRFGQGATRQFDGKLDMYRTSSNSYVPTLSSETEEVEYTINSLPEIDAETSVNVNMGVYGSGPHTIALKETMNMENYEAINLYDRQTNVTQNLLLNDTYSFNAVKGDKKERFVINLKPSTITNLNAAVANAVVTISSNSIDMVNIQVKNTASNLADVSIINVLGQEVFKQNSLDVSSGIGTLRIDNNIQGIYIVKALMDGRTYTKQIFLGK